MPTQTDEEKAPSPAAEVSEEPVPVKRHVSWLSASSWETEMQYRATYN